MSHEFEPSKAVHIVSWMNSNGDAEKHRAEDDLSLLIENGYVLGPGGSAGGMCWVSMVKYPGVSEDFKAGLAEYMDADEAAVAEAEADAAPRNKGGRPRKNTDV